MESARNFVKNTGVLLASRVFSIGLGIIYVAVLARYIHAAGIGKIATATSLVSILILLPNFGLNDLIVRDIAGDKSKTGSYFSNVFFMRGLFSILFGIILVGITEIIGYPPDTKLIIYIYGFSYVFDALTDIAFSIFTAYERMEYPAVLQAGRDLINVVLSLGAIYFHASLTTIVLISAVASLLKLGAGMVILRRKYVGSGSQINPLICRKLLIAALPFAALAFIALVNHQINIVLLSLYRPADDVGLFSAAATLIVYLLLFPNVFIQALFPVFARFNRSSKDALRRTYSLSFKYLMLFGFPLSAGLFVTADQVISLVYGSGFQGAVTALRIQAFLLLWMFIWANGTFLNATGKQTFFALMNGITVVLNIGLALLLIPRFSYIGSSIARTLPPAIFMLPITMVIHKQLEIKFPYSLVIRSLIAALGMGGAVALSLHFKIHLFISIFAVAPLVYGSLLAAFRAIGREDLLMVVRILKKRTSLAQVQENATNS